MASKPTIDGGVRVGKVVHHLDVGSMQPGEVKTISIPKRVLNEIHGVGHSDLHNTSGVSFNANFHGDHTDNDGIFGISLMRNTADGDVKQLETKGREVFMTEHGPAHGVHFVAHRGATQSAVHEFINDEMSPDSVKLALKRGSQLWSAHSPDSVHNGVYQSTATVENGTTQTKYVVADDSAPGVFITKNLDTIFKEYKTGSNMTTSPEGKTAYVVDENRFKNEIFPALQTALTPTQGNEHGYSLTIANMTDKVTKPGAKLTVSTSFHRTPVGSGAKAMPTVTYDTYSDAFSKHSAAQKVVHPKAAAEPVITKFDPATITNP